MTAILLTVSELRESLETDLSDEVLQLTLDAEEAEILRRHGPPLTAVATFTGSLSYLILPRPALGITTVTETNYDGLTVTPILTPEYRLEPGDKLVRVNGWYWGPLVEVTYVPVDMNAQRRLVLLQLATLAAKYSGLKQESIGSGDYSVTAADYNQERERLLSSLAERKLWVV